MASSIQIRIGGVDKTQDVSELKFGRTANGIGTASFVVSSVGSPYVPADDAAVRIHLDGATVPRWSGEIAEVDVTFLGWAAGTVCEVVAHDHNQRARRADPITQTIPSQSLKATLQLLTDPGGSLALQNVSLDPTQITGPTLDAITAVDWSPEALLNHVCTQAGLLWEIVESATPGAFVLSVFAVGSRVSGVTLSFAQGNVTGARWARQRYVYRNRQTVVYGKGPQRVVVTDDAEIAARGRWNNVQTNTEITTEAEAQAWGAALIRQNKPRPPMPTITTTAAGLDAGETVVVDLPAIDLAQTCLVQAWQTTAEVAEDQVELTTEVALAGGDERQMSSLELWRLMLAGQLGTGGAGSGLGGGVLSQPGGIATYPLGGNIGSASSATPTWVDAPYGIEPELDASKWEGGAVVAKVATKADSAGVSCTPRIVWLNEDGSVGGVAGDGVAKTSTSWTPQTIVVALQAGITRYRLQLLPGVANEGVSGTGYLEAGV